MRRHYIIGSIILLAVVAGCILIFLFTGATLRSGSDTIPGRQEQTTGVIQVHTPSFSPTLVTMNTSPKTASMTTSTPAVTLMPSSSSPYIISATALEQRVHELINQQRTDMGLGALTFDPALADIARKHSEDMAAQHYFAHVNPAGQDPTSRATADGYTCRKTYGSYYTYGIAENLFQNNLYSSATFYNNRETVYNWNSPEAIAQTTVAGWMNSSGHKKNILTRTFDREGIGVAIASEKVYITENFC